MKNIVWKLKKIVELFSIAILIFGMEGCFKNSVSTKPKITLKGESRVEILVGSVYIEPGYSAIGKNGDDVTRTVTLSGWNHNVSEENWGDIKYSLYDKDGTVLDEVTRRVIVSRNNVIEKYVNGITKEGKETISDGEYYLYGNYENGERRYFKEFKKYLPFSDTLYNDKGICVNSKYYDGNVIYEYKYDEVGNLFECQIMKDGNLSVKTVYKNNIPYQKYLYQDSKKIKEIEFYDGVQIKSYKVFDGNDVVSFEKQFEYDDYSTLTDEKEIVKHILLSMPSYDFNNKIEAINSIDKINSNIEITSSIGGSWGFGIYGNDLTKFGVMNGSILDLRVAYYHDITGGVEKYEDINSTISWNSMQRRIYEKYKGTKDTLIIGGCSGSSYGSFSMIGEKISTDASIKFVQNKPFFRQIYGNAVVRNVQFGKAESVFLEVKGVPTNDKDRINYRVIFEKMYSKIIENKSVDFDESEESFIKKTNYDIVYFANGISECGTKITTYDQYAKLHNEFVLQKKPSVKDIVYRGYNSVEEKIIMNLRE